MSRTRKILLVLLCLVCAIALACGISSCSTSKEVTAESIAITSADGSKTYSEGESISLYKDDTLTLSVIVSPSDAADKTFTSDSSDANVAAVTSSGSDATITITAKGEGTATITVTASSNSDAKATLKVTVTEKTEEPNPDEPTEPTEPDEPDTPDEPEVSEATVTALAITCDGVENNEVTVTYADGTTISFSVKATMSDNISDSDVEVTWKSSNEEVATIDENGTLTIVGAGETTVTATYGTGEDAITSNEIKVTVTAEQSEGPDNPDNSGNKDAYVTGITISTTDDTTIEIGGEITFTAEVTMSDGSDYEGDISWSSSVDGVVTIDDNGKVTGATAGTTKITATAGDQTSNEIEVTVNAAHVTDVTITASGETSIERNGTLSFTAEVTMSDGSEYTGTITWNSSEEGYATISDGVVTAVAAGTTTITATAGGVTSTGVDVTVKEPSVTKVEISATDNTAIEIGGTVNITVNVTMSDDSTYEGDISWISSVDGVVTIDDNGKVTGATAGTTKITATAGDQTSNEIEVTVNAAHVTGVTITASGETSIERNGTLSFTAEVTMSDGSQYEGTVEWKSSDESCATISNGVITVVDSGTTTITATAGGVESSGVLVTVKTPSVTKVEIATTDNTTIEIGDTINISVSVTMSDDSTYDGEIEWSFSEDGIVTVEDNVATGIADGTTTITAKAGEVESDSISVTVNAKAEPSLTISGDTEILIPGNTTILTLSEDNGYDMTSISWSSETDDVATISGSGEEVTVTGVLFGSTKITVSATVNGQTVSTSTTVYVTASYFYITGLDNDWSTRASSEAAYSAGVLLDATSEDENIYTLSVHITDVNYGFQVVYGGMDGSWTYKMMPSTYYDAENSDTEYMDYSDSEFKVTEAGYYVITLNLTDGVAKISVTESSIDVEDVILTVNSGNPALQYENGEGTSVVYKVSTDPEDATYDATTQFSAELSSDYTNYNNYVECKADASSMTVTVTCLGDPDEQFTATLTVTIAGIDKTATITVMTSKVSTQYVTEVTFTQSQYFIKVDQGTYSPDLTVQVSASVNENATVQGVSYSLTSQDESSYITLSTDGTVTAAAGTLGTYSITATSNGTDENNQSVTSTCEVTVYSSAFYITGASSSWGYDSTYEKWTAVDQNATSLTSPYSSWSMTASDSTNKTFSGTFTIGSDETWKEFGIVFLGMDSNWDGQLSQKNNMGTYSGNVFYEEGYTKWSNDNFQFQSTGSVTITIDLSGLTPTVNFS